MRAKRDTSRVNPIASSESEVERMLVEGLVNEWLATEHRDLMLQLQRRAKDLLGPLDETQLRRVAAAKIGGFEASLVQRVQEALDAS